MTTREDNNAREPTVKHLWLEDHCNLHSVIMISLEIVAKFDSELNT